MTAERWRGLVILVTDAVDHGATAIERVHLATAGRVFAVLEAVPHVASVARLVHTIHDTSVSTTYATVRHIDHLIALLSKSVARRGTAVLPPAE